MSKPIAHTRAGLLPPGPASITHGHVDVHDRIAAALTRGIGSMWVYATATVVAAWDGDGDLGAAAHHRHPFAFMLFLGNVVQLLLCFVILVGQRVIGHAADRRARETYENAEAIFQEVSALHDHLVRQDRHQSREISLMEWADDP